MSVSRRTVVAAPALAAIGLGHGAAAATYPDRTVRLVVPLAPGGVGDVIGRILADKAGQALGQTIIVDNRAGANSVIGTTYAARARPDGYTILQIAAVNIVVTALQTVPFDLEHDFTPVIGLGETPLALAVPSRLNIHSIDDLAAYARTNGRGLNYASGGVGSLGHLSAARLSRELNVERAHVPYKGNSLAVESMLRGDTDLLFGAVLDVQALARSGELTLLAVTSAERVPTLPNIPTMLELGHAGFTATLWYGYVVPAGTPQDVIDVLAAAITKAAAQPDLLAQFARLGVIVRLTPAPAFARFMREEFERWKKVIVENSIKAEE